MTDRYTPMYAETATDRYCHMLKSPTGSFVLASDYDALRARLAEVERDAARYRFVRERMEVRPQQAVSGSVRDALTVRIGCAFLDSPVSKRRSLSDPDAHETGCKKFDAAIDAFLGDKP